MSERPTFYIFGLPVRAAGILLWTNDGNKVVRLFNDVKGRFEDLGGKTDIGDKNALHTAIREATEETNGHIFSEHHTPEQCANMLYEHAIEYIDQQYNQHSKYLLFRVYVQPSILRLNMKRFGRDEKTEWGILPHYFKWKWKVPFGRKLHPRLRGLEL